MAPRHAAVRRHQSPEAGVAVPPGLESWKALAWTRLAGIARIPHSSEPDVVAAVPWVRSCYGSIRVPRIIVPRADAMRFALVPFPSVSQKKFGLRRIFFITAGITFLGWRIFPDHRRLVRGNVVRFRRRLRWLQQRYSAGEADWPEILPHLQAWNAQAAHGDTWKLREQVFSEGVFRRR